MVISTEYYPLNAFRICVDNMGADIRGRAYSPLKKEEILFSGVGELLVKMDELFDDVGYPQAFQDKRSFDVDKERSNLYRGIPKSVLAADKIVKQYGICKTVDVLVISRKNTSWQGELYDDKGVYSKNFDGEIELLSSIV